MTDTKTKLTGKGYIELPFLREYTPEPQKNMDRPYYNDYFHREGFVAWWDNRTGKGMIVDYRNNLEHKIELKDIKWAKYGALVPGSMVEYEYSDEGINKGFSKFWVVSGCERVLYNEAWENDQKYLYMQKEKHEYYERGAKWI